MHFNFTSWTFLETFNLSTKILFWGRLMQLLHFSQHKAPNMAARMSKWILLQPWPWNTNKKLFLFQLVLGRGQEVFRRQLQRWSARWLAVPLPWWTGLRPVQFPRLRMWVVVGLILLPQTGFAALSVCIQWSFPQIKYFRDRSMIKKKHYETNN